MLYYGIELARKTEFKNLIVERGATDPDPLTLTVDDRGRIFYNTTTQSIDVFNGSSWTTITGGGGGGGGGSGVTSFNARTGAVLFTAADVNAVINQVNLPVASASVAGVIKVGTGLTISNGVLSATQTGGGGGPTPPSDIPAGSVMLFAQSAAPTGWTQVVTTEANNRMLRVVSTVSGTTGSGGTGGFGYGGTDSPILNNKVPSHTHSFSGAASSTAGAHSHTVSGSTNTTGDHTHDYTYRGTVLPQSGGETLCWYGTSTKATSSAGAHSHTVTGSTNTVGDHSHTVTGSIGSNGGADTWSPAYLNLIMCSKN